MRFRPVMAGAAAISVLMLGLSGAALVHPAGAASRLNVVEILIDDASPVDIQGMTYTQSLGNWIRFDNHYDHISTCCPSRVDLMSGEYSDRDGVEDNDGSDDGVQFDELTALPVAMQNAGYHTILDGKYLNHYGTGFDVGRKPAGWDRFMAFQDYSAYYNYTMLDQGVTPVHYGGNTNAQNYSTNVIRKRFLADLQAAPAGQPVYAVAAPFATHYPWDTSGTVYNRRYSSAIVTRTPAFNEPDVSDKPTFIQQQAPLSATTLAAKQRKAWAAAAGVDDLVRQTVATLQATGRWDTTVLMVLADNGYSWGDHRWQFKKCEYASCMHIPLMVRYPGSGGGQVNGLSQQVDVARTIADIGGATPLRPQDGISFLPTLQTGAATRRQYVIERWGGGGAVSKDNPQGFSAYRTQDWLYVRLTSGEHELYDEQADPFELQNLADQPQYTAKQAELDGDLTQATAGEPAPKLPAQDTADNDDN